MKKSAERWQPGILKMARRPLALGKENIEGILEDSGSECTSGGLFSSEEDSDDDNYETSSDVETDSENDGDQNHQRGLQDDQNHVRSPAWAQDCGIDRCPFPFTGSPGVKVQFEDPNNPLEIVKFFIDNKLLEIIVTETNRFADQFIAAHRNSLKQRSRVHKWTPTNADEVIVFLALLYLQGIVQKPENGMYFSRNEILETPIFYKTMSESRFSLLLKFLHFFDNTQYNPDSGVSPKLYKLKPILDHLQEKFQQAYTPEREISIDESLLLWKGRLSTKQYIPMKRARFGIKSFCLCEAASGYVYRIIVYTGHDTIFDPRFSTFPLSSKVVMSLLTGFLNQGYIVCTDNFYTSPELYDYLVANKTDCVGTVRNNRKGMPPELKKDKLKAGELKVRYRGKLMAMRWKDKKDVYTLSSIYRSNLCEVRKHNTVKMKPEVILKYNDRMGGVDLSDQYLVNYACTRKRLRKYYIKQFRHLMDITALNSYLIHKKLGGTMDRLQFQLKLIENILETYTQMLPLPSSTKPGRPSLAPIPSRLTGRHFPKHIPPTDKKENPTRSCKVCCSKKDQNGKRIRRETRVFCRECDVGLCAIPCFEIFHTKKAY